MALARDEAWGLAIALVIGGSALGLFAYRQVRGAPAPIPAHQELVDDVTADDEATQAARDTFAEALEIAFVDDGTDASVEAKGTTLEISWFPCSKLMLQRLVRRTKDALTKKVRDASGLTLDRLRLLGFTAVVCDNTRGARVTDDLAPRRRRR